MKHIHLSFMILLIAGSCLAQPNSPRPLPVLLPDTAFIYSTKGNIYGFYHYIYDEKALRTEEHYYISDNGQFTEQARRCYTYDARGNVLSDLRQQKTDGKWKNQFQNMYAYDAQNRITLVHNQLWTDSLGCWYSAHCFHYTYNAQGLVDTFSREDDDSGYIAQSFYRYNPHGMLTHEQWRYRNDTGWMDTYRATITYDTADRMLTYLEENWNHTHGGPPKLEWEPWLNYIYTYDSLGNKTELFTRAWLCEEEEWINEKHYFYTYDSLQRCTEECYYAWSRGNDAKWVKKSLTFYTYDEQSHCIQSLVQTPYLDGWTNSRLTAFSYDNRGNLTAKMEEYWNMTDSCWERNALYGWDFHANGFLTGETFSNWNPQQKEWQGIYRTTRTFNGNDDEETVCYEMYDSRKGWYPFENTLYVLYHGNRDTLGTFHTPKVRVCYRLLEDSLPEDGIAGFRDIQLQCSPNPAEDKIFLTAGGTDILRCQLFSTDGRLCLECFPQQSGAELSVAHLPAGTYIVRCLTGKGLLSQTIIKR